METCWRDTCVPCEYIWGTGKHWPLHVNWRFHKNCRIIWTAERLSKKQRTLKLIYINSLKTIINLHYTWIFISCTAEKHSVPPLEKFNCKFCVRNWWLLQWEWNGTCKYTLVVGGGREQFAAFSAKSGGEYNDLKANLKGWKCTSQNKVLLGKLMDAQHFQNWALESKLKIHYRV